MAANALLFALQVERARKQNDLARIDFFGAALAVTGGLFITSATSVDLYLVSTIWRHSWLFDTVHFRLDWMHFDENKILNKHDCHINVHTQYVICRAARPSLHLLMMKSFSGRSQFQQW